MAQGGLARAVGMVLALLFSLTMAAALPAVLIADFMQPSRVVSEHAGETLAVCALAGFLGSLISWWLQGFAAGRGAIVRFLYGFLVFVLVFCALGGLLEVARKMLVSTGPLDLSVSGLYFSSLSGFYAFLLFLILPPRLALLGLWLAAGLVLALVGPRRTDERRAR